MGREHVRKDEAASPDAEAADVVVRTATALRQAAAQARPGTRILLAPGTYPGGFHFESNRFRHTDTVGSTGVQGKGGTSQVIIRRNRFENAGGRAVNIGGSTGRQFFRPPLKAGEAHCEAKDIRVEGNTFLGAGTPVAFVGVDGAIVRFNTIHHPKRWALRILQETRAPDFVPSRNVECHLPPRPAR
jgi:hypothetical protein